MKYVVGYIAGLVTCGLLLLAAVERETHVRQRRRHEEALLRMKRRRHEFDLLLDTHQFLEKPGFKSIEMAIPTRPDPTIPDPGVPWYIFWVMLVVLAGLTLIIGWWAFR